MVWEQIFINCTFSINCTLNSNYIFDPGNVVGEKHFKIDKNPATFPGHNNP